jgi:hypothetical protein
MTRANAAKSIAIIGLYLRSSAVSAFLPFFSFFFVLLLSHRVILPSLPHCDRVCRIRRCPNPFP